MHRVREHIDRPDLRQGVPGGADQLGVAGESRRITGDIEYLPRLEPQLDLGDVTLHDLLAAVQEALDAIPTPPVGEIIAPITVTIAEQITHIEEQLARRRQIRFREVLSEATTRVEIIVTLLALLELIKQDRARVWQERLFGEIVIERQTLAEAAPADVPATNPTA